MRFVGFAFVLLVALGTEVSADSHIYPSPDFYNRNIELPIDHANPEAGTFTLYYQIRTNFDPQQPTVLYITDGQQEYTVPGDIENAAQRDGFGDWLNLVMYEHRGRPYSYIDIRSEDGDVDWARAYHILSSWQVVEDIEAIRLDLLAERPDTKVYLYGRSGGGYLAQEYLAKYSEHVERALIGCAPNPLVMEELGHPESKNLFNSLNAVDPALDGRLEAVLESDVVPDLELLWVLLRLGYAHQDAGDIQAAIINELSEGRTETYDEYRAQRGFDFTQVLARTDETAKKAMGVESFIRPLECDGAYLLGPDPDYVDPLYRCLREISLPLVKVIEGGAVDHPRRITPEELRSIETEVFCMMASKDHVAPPEIGVALGRYLEKFELFIADDNHRLREHPGCCPTIRDAFFRHGLGSRELQEARASSECVEWIPE